MKTAYVQQVRALIAGGSDLLLVETIFDSLNAKAALVAIQEVFDAGRRRAAGHDLGGGRPRRRDDDLGADHRGVLERGQAREAAVGRPQLLARARPDVPVPRGARREVDDGDLVLSERRPAQPAVADRLRSRAAGHGALPRRLRQGRPDQHRRRLLRQHARAHRGHRQGARRTEPPRDCTAPSRASPATSVACRRSVAERRRTAAALGLAAVHAAARRVHDDRRAHQRRRLAEVRQADQGGQVRGSRQRRPAAGRERRQRHRHLHGRRDDRRRRGDDALPAAARQRARGRQGPVHGRLLEVGGHRGRAQVPPGQGHRQLDLAEGRRGRVPRSARGRSSRTARPSS